MKMRESGYDPAIREFRITDNGIEVASTFTSAEAILTGIARPVATGGAPSLMKETQPLSQDQQI
jgi:circadian clock protein KaiC